MKAPHSGSKKPYATIDVKPTKVEEASDTTGSVPMIEASAAPAAEANVNAQPEEAPGLASAAPSEAQASAATDSDLDPRSASTAGGQTPPDAPNPSEQRSAAPGKRAGVGSLLTHLAAGFAGGFVALLSADSIGPQFGFNQQPAPASTGETQRRLSEIEKSIANRPAGIPADVEQQFAALDKRLSEVDQLKAAIAALDASQGKLASNAAALEKQLATATAPSDVSARVGKLEETLATMAAAGANDPQSGRLPQLAALAGRIGDLETTLANQITGLRNQLTQDINARTEKIAEGSEAARSGTQRIDRELAAIKAETARVGQRFESLKGEGDRLASALQGVREEGQTLKSAMEAARAETAQQMKSVARPDDVASAVTPIASKLAAMDQTVQGVVKNETERKVTAERIVLALELGNLKRALERGGGYATELNAVKQLAGPKLDLTVLETRKAQGVPTLADLSRDFRQAVHKMLDAETDRDDASVLDRLVAGAKSVIRVRKVGQGADDRSPEAVIARMEQALQDGRLAAVVEEARKLSPKAQGAAHDWLAAVEARATVDAALAQIDTQLKTALTAKPGTPQGTN